MKWGAGQEAEDLTQEVFLGAFRSLDKFDYRCAFFTWLCSILKKKMFNLFGQPWRRVVSISDHDELVPSCSEEDPARGADFDEAEQELANYLPNNKDRPRVLAVFKHGFLINQ